MSLKQPDGEYAPYGKGCGTHRRFASQLVAADIGGTTSRMALLGVDHRGDTVVLDERSYPSRNFSTIEELIRTFLGGAAPEVANIDTMLLALPGPVASGQCQLTNLEWHVDAGALAAELSVAHVELINDFQATAAGIDSLNDDDFLPLNTAPAEEGGVRVVTGAGTGLGLAWMVWQDGGYQIQTTEGGHIDFAPTTPLQVELWQSLHSHYPRLSCERLLSGEGLEAIYRFIVSREGGDPASESPPAAQITDAASQGSPPAVMTVELFIEIYGSWVGNLALLYRPGGGLYIAGGMGAKMATWMASEIFIRACYNKGRMADLVRRTPIRLVTNERLGLQGAIATALDRIRKRGVSHG